MAENRWEFFYRYLIVCFVSEIVWWGKENVKQIREAFLSAERVSQFPGADNCSYKQTVKKQICKLQNN